MWEEHIGKEEKSEPNSEQFKLLVIFKNSLSVGSRFGDTGTQKERKKSILYTVWKISNEHVFFFSFCSLCHLKCSLVVLSYVYASETCTTIKKMGK